MKITILSVFYPFRGGIAQFSAALKNGLEKNNKVFLINFKRQYPQFLFPGKTQYVDESDNVDSFTSERLIDSINPFSFFKTVKRINTISPDLLIVNYWMTFFGFAKGYIAGKSKAKKKVALIHNLIPHEKKFYDTFVNRYFLSKFDGFVVMSEQVRKDVLSLRSDAKIIQLEHPIYNHFGVKIDKLLARESIGISQDKKILLFFGLIRPYKGLNKLIQLLSLLDESYELLIVGECYGTFDEYQLKINELRLNNRIKVFNKYVPDSEVSLYFSAADLCVLPYLSATQSGIVAVSKHFELPVIATKVGGLAESVLDNEEGFIVDPNNIDEFKHKIEQYFNSSVKEIFLNNIKKRNKHLTWEYFSNKVIEFSKRL